MNYVNNVNDFVQLIHSREEVILFSRGGEGYVTLEFLRYSNYIERICCVAASRVDKVDNTLQKFDHFRPVIPFEYLLHFRESAIMLVAIPPQIHEQTDQFLAKIGFKNVVFLSPAAISQLQAALKQFSSSGQVMSWFINHVTDKITDLEGRIDEQNEVCAVNTKAFAEYRNCFRGKKIVIFASGPTAKYYKPIPDAIHIGVNFSWRSEHVPLDYLFAVDGKIDKPGKTQFMEGFDKIREKIFVGMYVPRRDNTTFPENYSLRKNVHRFYFAIAPMNFCKIYKDICYHATINVGSVAHTVLQFAMYTYPKEIYLVGCDTNHGGHFYNIGKPNNNFFLQNVKVGYARLKMFAKHHYPDTKIISINPVGLKGLFNDVYTEDYLASLNENK